MIGHAIRVGRAVRQVSQLDLSLSIGCSPGRLWKIEKGLVAPTRSELRSIAQTLDLPILLELESPPPRRRWRTPRPPAGRRRA